MPPATAAKFLVDGSRSRHLWDAKKELMWFLRFSLSVICIAIVVAAGLASRSFKVLCDTICIRRLQLRRIYWIYCRGCMDLCILLSLNNWNLISKQAIRFSTATGEGGLQLPERRNRVTSRQVVIRTFRCLWVQCPRLRVGCFPLKQYPVTYKPALSPQKQGLWVKFCLPFSFQG